MVGHPGNLEKVLTSASRKILNRRAAAVLQAARTEAGAVAPDLRYTVDGNDYRNMSAKVGSNNPEVKYAEKGIKPYIIRPKNAKFLVFPGTKNFKGQTIFAKIVHHPGTAGKHFLRNALRRIIRF
jgi:hypothetical protein